MRRLNRYCPVRQQIKMSIHPTNCYSLAHRQPLAEHALNLHQIEWKSKTLCRLYFNGDVTQRCFMRTYNENHRNIFETLGAMERRADNVVFRSLFAESVFAARKMVSSGRITVNGRECRLPDYRLQDGDLLQVKPKYAHEVHRLASSPWLRIWAFTPKYLEVSHEQLASVFLHRPLFAEIPSPYPVDTVRNMGAFFSKRGYRPQPSVAFRAQDD